MKFTHTIRLDIEGKKVELQVRELTKKEALKLQEKHEVLKTSVDEITELQKKAHRLKSKIERLQERLSVETSTSAKLVLMDERDLCISEIESLEDSIVGMSLKPFDNDLDQLFKERLELACSGKGLDEILEIADKYGYKRMWYAIAEAVEITEKKQ